MMKNETNTMRIVLLFTAAFFLSTSINAQTAYTDEVMPYEYDTILKGGYNISFKADDSLQYLYLKKGNKTIKELSFTSIGLPHKNLGYVVTDFKEYFVLAHSFGSGNPHRIELIKKSTGVNILDKPSAWIDADEEKELLLYSTDEVPTKKSKMILFNAKTRQKELFSFPSDIIGQAEVFNRIQIVKLTNKEFIITYDTNGISKVKVYSR
jgi:hypothetical protein